MSEVLRNINLCMEVRHRTTGECQDRSVWKEYDTFSLYQCLTHGMLFVFMNESMKRIEKQLKEWGYEFRVAMGRISRDEKKLYFTEPAEPFRCKELLQKIIVDANSVAFFSDLRAVAPNGEDLGRISDYVTTGQA